MAYLPHAGDKASRVFYPVVTTDRHHAGCSALHGVCLFSEREALHLVRLNPVWPGLLTNLAFVVVVESAIDPVTIGQHLAGMSARTSYREVIYYV